MLAPAAAHSERKTTCCIAVEFIKNHPQITQMDVCKNIFGGRIPTIMERSNRQIFAQKDRKRHCQSDKIRLSNKCGDLKSLALKAGEPSHS